jgi:RNA polymerase sigma factor (sigma-70 family)
MATSQLRRVVQTLRRTTLPEGEDLTDGQLLECYVRGREEAAFAALVDRHGPMVWHVCLRVLGRHQDAEDAFQATFLVLVRKAVSVVPREMVANWLYGVAHQTALKARATTARRRTREKQVAAMPEPAFEQELWDDLQPLLDQELRSLPDKYRAVLVLCDLEGKTRKEAARHLHVPEGTVASRLATARGMLAKRMARHGLAVSGTTLAALLSPGETAASVPASVASSTIKAATLFAAGEAATRGVLSDRAVALAEGVLKTMLLTKLKITATVLVALAVLGAGAAALTQQLLAATPAEQPATEKQPAPGKPALGPVKENKEAETLPEVVSGVATAVDAEKRTLTVAHREGEDTFSVAKDARIDLDGKPGHLAWLPKGANVTLSRFVGPKTTANIQANGRWYYGAPVKTVDVTKNTITIKDREEEKTFVVAPDACIAVDGKGARLAAVPPGAFVNLGLGADQRTVLTIGADGPCLGGCYGSLVKAVDGVLGTITFDDKEMPEVAGKTFTVARDALITIDGKPGNLSALPVGCYVSLGLRVDQQTAGQVRAQGPSNVCDCHGSLVKAVDVSSGTITFDDKARAEVAGKTFTLAKDALIAIDGKPGKLSDIPPGCYVQMNLCVDRQTVGMIHAQGPSNICDCGGSLVTTVDAEKRTITFDDKARTEVAGKTFAVAKNANITIDGKPGKLADLPAGSYVGVWLCVDRQTVGTINASGPAVPGVGLVKAVDAEKNVITVEDKTYPVATNANIVIDGKAVKLAGVPAGVYVTLRLCVDQKTVGTIFHTRAP